MMQAGEMTAVGFEPTQLALVELESTPLDHSGKLSLGSWANCVCSVALAVPHGFEQYRCTTEPHPVLVVGAPCKPAKSQ